MKTKAQSFMKRSVAILVMLACALASSASAGQGAMTFYVQLVLGTETMQPPVPGCKQVGPRLNACKLNCLDWEDFLLDGSILIAGSR